MTMPSRSRCADNRDPRKLIRQGTDQVLRADGGPDPSRVPVDERLQEHAVAFAAAYARYLLYVDVEGSSDGSWQDFFSSDVTARLAVVAIEDVAGYRATLTELLRRLADPPLPPSEADLVAALRKVFDCLGTLAARLDALALELPPDQPLGDLLRDLIRTGLSPALQRLLGYYRAGLELGVLGPDVAPAGDLVILGEPLRAFSTLLTVAGGLRCPDWAAGVGESDWAGFVPDPAPYRVGYGAGASTIERANHLGTHNLFRGSCDTFLAGLARIVETARTALHATLEWDGHQPHYALFLAFLQLLDHARTELNRLPAEHLDFYYGEVLRLARRPAEPGRAHVLVELAKHVESHRLPAGTLLKAGKDGVGRDAFAAADRDLVANRAWVAELRSLYRHPRSTPPSLFDGRVFATAEAATGESWHPFVEKRFADGVLRAIETPAAEVGFAVASHYLWLAEGERTITLRLALARRPAVGKGRLKSGAAAASALPALAGLRCRLTVADGWLDVTAARDARSGSLILTLGGDAPAITGYDAAVHGYGFGTGLPVLLVTLPVAPAAEDVRYGDLAELAPTGLTLSVAVKGRRTLTLANDQGPVDPSKPFLAFGSNPASNSALLIGCAEAFRKSPDSVTLTATFPVPPRAHAGPQAGAEPQGDAVLPSLSVDQLSNGTWQPLTGALSLPAPDVPVVRYPLGAVRGPVVPDLSADQPYTTATRSGFVRLRLSGGFGQDLYPISLAGWVTTRQGAAPQPPVLPTLAALTLDYTAQQDLDLTTRAEAGGRFFHVTPFGHTEPTRAGGVTGSVPLLPQFRVGKDAAEGALYLGVAGLAPPQNLALLVQVADGTADPLAVKPEQHLHWSYLRGDDWLPFAADAVADGTDGLLASGIVTLAVPPQADVAHTLLPAGLHWIRVAVAARADAVCRLIAVAAQAMSVTDLATGSRAPGPGLPAATISKLDPPAAQVKGITQPFPGFGGRPVETDAAFAVRVSERLRHKDRAIALWDYEHLILEAFPGIYRARCLNHTRYEPGADGGVYRELAPGHVTVVTIPDLAVPNPFDPLRPFTSLRLLGEIERFLARRMSCFATLHVRNPQFEEVKVSLRVRLRSGVDESAHLKLLKQQITEFLSPWAFRGSARPTFDGTIHKSVLVSYLEDLDYVDYLTDVRLDHLTPDTAGNDSGPEEVVGSRAVSILVSVPADRHDIKAIRGGASASGGCDPHQDDDWCGGPVKGGADR